MGSRRRHIGNMGKRKETSEDDTRESSSTSPKKKHKRKHKKHKKKKDHGPEGYDEERKKEKNKEKSKSRGKEKDGNKGGGRAVKLKIKLRGETVATTQMAKIVPVKLKEPVISSGEEDEPVEEDNFQQTWQGNEKEEPEVTEKERRDSDEQEEQKWLDALERGELDDFGRVKQDKDVSMMTARQRAMLGHEIEGENQLLELPTEPRRKNEDSEEAQKRRKQRAKKRKQQMQKKIEENKTQTVKKLLDREATRSRKEEEKARRKKQEVPHIRYISNQNGFALSFSKGLEFPLQVQLPHKPPEPRSTCAAQGCMNLKKYSCSSNKLPVCSMECYKKVNLLQTAVV